LVAARPSRWSKIVVKPFSAWVRQSHKTFGWTPYSALYAPRFLLFEDVRGDLGIEGGRVNLFIRSATFHRPDQVSEILLTLCSVVRDSNQGTSFVLVLDAQSFTELARAEVPYLIPFGIHGMYTRALHSQ